MNACGIRCFLLVLICFCAGCANITAPTGGKKDIIPPKLIAISPADSLLNTKVKRIDMTFDEYITVSDASKEVEISPMLSIQPTETGLNKKVTVKIVDSLLEENTTYRLSFGKSIKDLHEGNVFANYVYTFSTGSYFDSLQLSGNVINAATGTVDTGSVFVELYSAKESDSAVVRHKPKYITKADNNGHFVFKGLPRRSFRIYAIKDANGNLIYDGPAGGEMIAFTGKTITPGDTDRAPILLKLFQEVIDSDTKKSMDTVSGKKGLKRGGALSEAVYTVNVDTTKSTKRTFDINNPINIPFKDIPTINKDKITLTYDSAGVTMTPAISIRLDSVNKKLLRINTKWVEDAVYTLRLVKGFAKDTGGKDLPPSKYIFHTKQDEDYGKIHVHLPAKYDDTKYILMVIADKDTVYQEPVTDTVINLVRLKPAKYTFRIIVDENRNGHWDTGDLFGGKQPEEVVPYPDQITLKANWEIELSDWDKIPVKNASPKDGKSLNR